MAQAVLVAHSAGPQGPGEGTAPFVGRLREGLGPAYDVHFPIMPDPEKPQYAPWSKRLGQVIGDLTEQVVVVGHSLGGSVVLKHFAETGSGKDIAGLVLVAVPFWGKRDWEAEWALPEGWPAPSTKLPPTVLFHSRDDEEAPFDHLERYAERLPDATARPLDGNGHLFDRGDLTEVLAAVRRLTAGEGRPIG